MIDPSMTDRERKILQMVVSEDGLSIRQLSKTLGVSLVTIRSDIANLMDKGIILKTRGGITPTVNSAVLQRYKSMFKQKNLIARAAAEMIQSGDTVMIEAGTTTALIGKYLLGKWNIRVVTNSLLILPYLRINPGVQLCLVGGDFRPQSETLVGPMALKQLDSFHVRLAFVGTDGMSVEDGFTSQMVEAAEVVRKMAERSDLTVLLADSSKYGKRGFTEALPLGGIDVLITDSGMNDQAIQLFNQAGVKVQVAH